MWDAALRAGNCKAAGGPCAGSVIVFASFCRETRRIAGNSPQMKRGHGAPRHGSGVSGVIPLLARSCPSLRTTPASGQGFPSVSEKGNFGADFRDRN